MDNSAENQPEIDEEFTDLPLEDEDNNPGAAIAGAEENSAGLEGNSGASEPEETHPLPGAIAGGTTAYDPEASSVSVGPAGMAPEGNQGQLVEIVDAGKSKEGQSRGYIVYTIRYNGQLVRRRYSEFESLRNALVRLFPTVIVPPIPLKHKITTLATAPLLAKGHEDTAMIEHRQRMLAVFLRRCLNMDRIRDCQVLQNFLDPMFPWDSVLHSPPLSLVPKNPLQADPMDPANTSAAHSYLPVPSTSVFMGKESEDDRHFQLVEGDIKNYESFMANELHKTNKAILKELQGLTGDLVELGGEFNSFSLQENGGLASSLEALGAAFDSLYLSNENLTKRLNYDVVEPMGESIQYSAAVRDVLKFRFQKSLQVDITTRLLKYQHNKLGLLEKSEMESQKIEHALQAETGKSNQINFQRPEEAEAAAAAATTPLEFKKSSNGFKIPGLSKLNNMIKEVINEVDPELNRQESFRKVKEELNQLKQTNAAANSDLKAVTEDIKQQLALYERNRNAETREMLVHYNKHVLDWCRGNLELWKEVKSSIN